MVPDIDVTALIRANDPAPVADAAYDTRAAADLQVVLAGPRPEARAVPGQGRRPSLRRPLTGLLVTAMLFAVALVGRDLVGPNTSAYAATPPPLGYAIPPKGTTMTDARNEVETIRAAAERSPDPAAEGFYKVSWQAWSLATRVGATETTSRVVPMDSTVVRSMATGEGTDRTTRDGVSETRPADSSGLIYGRTPIPDLAALRRELPRAHPGGDPRAVVAGITDLYRERPVPATLRAAVLTLVSELPGLMVRGQVIDRLGRPGVAFSVDSTGSGLETRYTLIFDAGTGFLLGSEETLTESAGKLNVKIPAVIAYEAFRPAVYQPTGSIGN